MGNSVRALAYAGGPIHPPKEKEKENEMKAAMVTEKKEEFKSFTVEVTFDSKKEVEDMVKELETS